MEHNSKNNYDHGYFVATQQREHPKMKQYSSNNIDHFEWKQHVVSIYTSNENKIRWLKGHFNGRGYVINHNSVESESMNEHLLIDIAVILWTLGIESNISKDHEYPFFRIQIDDKNVAKLKSMGSTPNSLLIN